MARIDLVKVFGNESAETFNKISKGYSMGRADTITELLETQKYDELSQKIAIDILERGITKGKVDGAREFANKLIDKFKENYENKDLAFECKKCMIWRREEILELLAEWQKGE